ncbi:MAG: MFS transporter [Labedaea sp.]
MEHLVRNEAGMGRGVRFRDVLGIGEFRALWVAELLSVAGDQLARVGLAMLVYQRTSSAGWTALVYALTLVPALLGGALLSGLADRYPRREVMVGVDLVRAVVAGAMALPFLPLPALMGLVFVLSLAAGPFKAAQQALLPTVLPGDRYVTGLALRQMTNQAAQLAGFAGGGLLLTVLGPYLALGLNAGTFAIGAFAVALGVRRRPAARVASADGESGLGGTVRFLWRDQTLRGLVAMSWLVGLFVVPEGLAAPYAAGLGASAAAIGVLMAADPAGSVIGAWLLGRIPERSRSALLTPLAVAAGLPLVVCVVQPGLFASVGLWAVSGACSTIYLILAQAAFTRRVPDQRRAAASGLVGTGVLSSQGIAIVGAGLVADATAPALTIASAGAAGALLAGLIGATWLRTVRSLGSHSSTLPSRGRADRARMDDDVTSPLSSSAPPPAGHAAEHGTGAVDQVIIARGPAPASNAADQHSLVVWRWPLWQAPARVLIFILVVEIAAVGLTVLVGRHVMVMPGTFATLGVILGFGLAMGEMSRHVERVRRRFNDTPHVNLTSVWIIPASLLLPPILAAAVVLLLYLHLFWRSWYRVRGVHAYRLTFSAAGAVLACYSAGTVFAHWAPSGLSQWNRGWTLVVVVLAVLAYSVVNSVLVAAAISLFEGRFGLRRALGTTKENALEFGTLGLGAIAALLITMHPAWPLAMIPALLVLHRSVLMRQLEEAAATDAKTGLTNAVAWTNAAARELKRAAEDHTTLGVLMVDLDHFKFVNDTHGHMVGDQVLLAVAETLPKAVRRHDLVGRWGGEEFAVLCPEVSPEELGRIGERVCDFIRRLRIPLSTAGEDLAIEGLTASIGVATYPEFGPDLDDLLLAADDALFVAKDQGRNQVQSIVPAVGAHVQDTKNA